MPEYLVQTAFKAHYLVQSTLVSSFKSISFMWGLYLVHKRILMIDKQIDHAVDYLSKALKVVAPTFVHYFVRPLGTITCV